MDIAKSDSESDKPQHPFPLRVGIGDRQPRCGCGVNAIKLRVHVFSLSEHHLLLIVRPLTVNVSLSPLVLLSSKP